MWSVQLSVLILLVVSVVTQKKSTYGCKSFGIDMEVWQNIGDKENQISQYIACGLPAIQRKPRQKLRKIESTNQTIYVLHKMVLSSFLHVEKIILSGNGITRVRKAAFKNLPLLKYVYLNNNKIAVLEFNIFVDVPKLLKLHLGNNQLWHFEQEWFGRVPTLEWLNLEYNLIKTITTRSFTNLANLIYINLSHNQIMHMDETAFEGLNRLEILDLSYNRIYRLQDNIFASTTQLQVLNLYSNHLTYISDQVLEKLTKLYELVVLFNPWQCGCYNKIFNWAKSESIGIQNDYLKCAKAENLAVIPTCVTIGNNLTECVPYKIEDYCDVLYLQRDFECYFQYDKYINL